MGPQEQTPNLSGAVPGRVAGGPRWWGSNGHILFTIIVFVILASLDNAAIGVLPPLYSVIALDLSVSETAIGIVTALTILIVAIAAVLWGYWGDRGGRKRLLLYGTVIWAVALLFAGISKVYLHFLLFQVVAAVGLGCIAAVGFSVVGDFISPPRRGLMMSLWGLSQGIGLGGGILLGGLLGAENWRLPFLLIAGGGLASAALYLFTYDPQRGRMEPELARVFASGGTYENRIEVSHIPGVATKPSNVWLILQGLPAQFAYGSLIWLPRLFQAKAEAAGYTTETATMVGSLFAIIFQIGGVASVLGGLIGDRWQRRDPRGRAMLSAIGIVGAIPFYLALFFMPLHELNIPGQADVASVVSAVLSSLLTNLWVAGSFLLALGALALTSLDSPNWLALINDVNLPEHRGTVFGLCNLSNGIGRSLGNGLTGVAFSYFSTQFPSPWNYGVALALFQLFFVPAGLCYYQATKTTSRDIAVARKILAARAQAMA